MKPDCTPDDLPDAALSVDLGGRIEQLNRAVGEMLLLDPSAPPHEIAPLLALPQSFYDWLEGDRGAPVLRLRIDARRSNGVPFAADLSAKRMRSGGALCLLREIPADRDGGEAQRYFDIAFETAPIGMALFNTDGEYTRVNESLCRMLGRSDTELLGRRDQEFTHPEDRQSDVDAAWRILAGEIDTWQCEKRFLHRDGSVVWAIANMTFLRDSDGHPLSWVGQFQDITERRCREAELAELADHDSLTGLLNRRAFERALEEMIAAEGRGAALLVDLDGFKSINDYFGHHAGDQALIAVARALGEELGAEVALARVGGDEFAAIVRGLDGTAAGEAAEALAAAVANTRFGFDPQASVGASVGIGLIAPELKPSLDSVLIEADLAMYRIKNGEPASSGDAVWRRRRTDWISSREGQEPGERLGSDA